jgi:hypothetical protein
VTQPVEAPEPQAAKGGGGTSSVTVTSADPNWAPQETTLSVRITGSGFDQGSRAEWAINGTVVDPAVVRTDHTTFVSAGELVATITIATTAPAVLYDVMVTTSGGRRGIGTEKFEVAPKGSTNPRFTNPHAAFELLDASGQTGGSLAGDGRAADGSIAVGPAVYEDGRCGVTSTIFLNNAGDATLDPIGASAGLCGAARAITLRFGQPIAGSSQTDVTAGHFVNVRKVLCDASVDGCAGGAAGDDPWEPTIDNPAERVFRLTIRNYSGCDFLSFEDRTVSGVAGRRIRVTRVDAQTWLAESQPDDNGRHVGFCEKWPKGAKPGGPSYTGAYDVPFRIVVRMK